MLFNSIDFAVFLPIVFLLYWFVFNRNLKVQNTFLLVASYVFYGWWDWRFLSLIILSSLVDYLISRRLDIVEKIKSRKLLLGLSLAVNLGLLCFFKYFNFFTDNFVAAFSLFGGSFQADRLDIVLPVGISFYTFQTLSYTIDVYRRQLKPTNDIVQFFAYVSFFPQLVAGPIERARNLLPQFNVSRKFQYHEGVDGLRQILWGLFKKVVIADQCAILVNQVFSDYTTYSGATLLLAAIFFSFQIYCDFSGYSDIAIGTAKLFGFKLMQNFKFPYFSRDVAEFWRRWHISLSTWFRDYLYIPLGGSKKGKAKAIRNTFIIFLVSGFWHGANWTFIAWGLIHATLFLPLLLTNRNRHHTNEISQGRAFASFKDIGKIILTFGLVTLAWVFFRAENISIAIDYLNQMFLRNLMIHPGQLILFLNELISQEVFYFLFLLLGFEWLNRAKHHGLDFEISTNFKLARWAVYSLLIISITWFTGAGEQFIYFQF